MIRLPNNRDPDWNGRRFAVATTVVSAIATGYLTVRGVVDPAGLLPGADAPAARTLGAYGAVRNGVLVAAPLVAVGLGRWSTLRLLLVLAAAVQGGDTVVGAVAHDAGRTVGPACFAVALAVAAGRLRPSRPTPARPSGPDPGPRLSDGLVRDRGPA